MRVTESESGRTASDPPSPASALFQPEYRSQRDPSCLSFNTLSRQALINISTRLWQPLGVGYNRYDAEAHTHTHTQHSEQKTTMWHSSLQGGSQVARRAPLFKPSAAACTGPCGGCNTVANAAALYRTGKQGLTVGEGRKAE